MDQAKKKQIKKIGTWVFLAALVITLTAMPLLAKNKAEADGPVATIHSGTVEEGTIHTALHGGGTLQTEGIEEINLPSGVKITEFLVKNGDVVKAGTPLAAVDKVSVMTAITSVTETMEYLQEEMKDARNEKVDSTISATAGGRIKKVFAQKGDSVQEVMLRDGALALLSLDGLMAVEIEKKLEILTGDTVTVTLSDSTEVTGRIASNLDGVIVITVEDEGYKIGQTVTVTGKDGSEIGTGELYVHNAWAATAFSGTIQTVSAKEETKVTAGSTLFTLTDTDFRGTLAYLGSLHREYEELMQDLFRMYHSGTIDAPCDGTISGVDKDSAHLLSASEEEALQVQLLTAKTTNSEKGWKVVLLSTKSTCGTDACSLIGVHTEDDCPKNVCTQSSGCAANPNKHDPNCIKACISAANAGSCPANKHYDACIESCVPQDGTCTKETGPHKPECIKSCLHASVQGGCGSKDANDPHYLDCIYSCVPSDGTKDCLSLKHWPGCIESCTHADTADACSANPYHYPDCIKSCLNSDSSSNECPASKHYDGCFFAAMTYKAKVAMVDQVGSTELVVRWDSSNQGYDVVKTGSGWAFVNPSDYNPTLLVNNGTLSVSNPSAYKAGDVILVITGYKGNQAEWSGIALYSRTAAGTGTGTLPGMGNMDMSALLGGMMGSFSGFGITGFAAPSVVEEEQLFDLEGSTLMTVSPQDTVSLIITLDEQDISKISVGQKATVKVEALSGESFEAKVTEIATRGVSSGGSSKFTAKLELPKAKNMLDGMSATASLPLEERKTVPTIPVVALAEQGTRIVVYTALDQEGNPAGPVPVTIGISDGITAEILSGLEVGDTYYYSYYDVLELDTGVEDRFTLT